LLDGLDELPGEQQTDHLFRRFAALPGRICVTCRTAIAQANKRELQPYVAPGGHHELLPLNEREQQDFLACCFEGDQERAAALCRRVRANSQLRELAGSPLLLGLIAEVGETTLPAMRTAFYREAVAEFWRRRVKSDEQERLRPHRDRALTALAATMTLEHVVAPMETLDQALAAVDVEGSARPLLVEALKTSGLIRVAREKVEFLHLTLQEFYLARHLGSGAFANALEDLWDKPRYEETLALLIAIAGDEGRINEVDQAVVEFIDGKLERHRHEPAALWRKSRSPLRLVFHVLGRAGINVEMPSLTWRRLQGLMAEDTVLLRLALAADRRSPAEVVTRLANDDDVNVRRGVAQNTATPGAVLARLASEDDADVRRRLAQNTATPANVLVRLAGDDDADVRCSVARNAATPVKVLARLADDDDADVRDAVAQNAATPVEVLARLAGDADADVRGGVAQNAATPLDLLARLALDDDTGVRHQVALHAATPADVLARLVRLVGDNNPAVRSFMARNVTTPAEELTRLAGDDDAVVRGMVASNVATSAELLARLAYDDDRSVRFMVALNPATPAAVLARLTGDDYVGPCAVSWP
jgi:hypothetical protein